MKKIILTLFFHCSVILFTKAQKLSVLATFKALDSLKYKTDTDGFGVNDVNMESYNKTTQLNPRDYFVLLGSNLKQEFTMSFHLKKRDWINLGKFATVAVSTIILDERIQKNALKLRNENKFIRTTGRYLSLSGGKNEIFTLAAFELYGLVTSNRKIKTTTLLATQALLSAGLLEAVIKGLTGRTRPGFYGPYEEAEPRFTGPWGYNIKNSGGVSSSSSFPSGHATAAFAVATVFAAEYKNKPVIPVIAYSIASFISISRITENKHWTSDILIGAALGYLTGRQVAFNYHRMARLKKHQKEKKASLTFNLQYSDWGKLLPGLVYRF